MVSDAILLGRQLVAVLASKGCPDGLTAEQLFELLGTEWTAEQIDIALELGRCHGRFFRGCKLTCKRDSWDRWLAQPTPDPEAWTWNWQMVDVRAHNAIFLPCRVRFPSSRLSVCVSFDMLHGGAYVGSSGVGCIGSERKCGC